MTRRYRATKLRTTFQASLGTKVPEKRVQLAFLADRIEIKGLPCPPIAGVEGHPIYKQAKAYPYEDISAYFAMVDEEVRQRRERANNFRPYERLDTSAFDSPMSEELWRQRMAPAHFAFAELGRIVGEHTGSPLLNAGGYECDCGRASATKHCSLKCAMKADDRRNAARAVLTETAPVKVKLGGECAECGKPSYGLETCSFECRVITDRKKLGGG